MNTETHVNCKYCTVYIPLMSFSSALKVASLGGRLAVLGAAAYEEADTKIVSHIHGALRAGHKSIVVITVDTDVIIILVGTHHHTISIYPDADIWVGFSSKTYRCYYINTIQCHPKVTGHPISPCYHTVLC